MNRVGLNWLALGCLVPWIASAEVYQCVSRFGIVNFSDQPCGPDAKAVELAPAPKIGTSLDPGYDDSLFYRFSESAKQEQNAAVDARRMPPSTDGLDRCPSDATLADRARFGRVLLCMTPAMVKAATSISIDYDVEQWLDAAGQWERWQFRTRREDWPYSVVFRDGRVVRVVEQFDAFDGYYVPPGAHRPTGPASR